jgi:microcompartment protein CcmK/EutM
MRIVEVIGTVTLSRAHSSLLGARWLIGVPYSLKALDAESAPDGEDLVLYDDLGAGNGCKVGISEGAEAAAPFYPKKVPVDAYCASIIDCIAISCQLPAISQKKC